MTSLGVFLSNTESYKYQIITKFLAGKIYRDQAAQILQVANAQSLVMHLELKSKVSLVLSMGTVIISLIKNMTITLNSN